MKQLTLPIQINQGNYFDSFYVCEHNQTLIQALRSFASAQSGHGLGVEVKHTQSFYIWGESGVGKSHLAYGVCQYAHQLGLQAGLLDLAQLDCLGAKALFELEGLDLVCWDNLDVALGVGDSGLAERLLHAYNRMRDASIKLLMTASLPPHELNLQLADFESRLNWGLTYQIKPLDDLDKVAALKLLGQERGIYLSESVAQFILRRVNRHMAVLGDVLDKLDSASLSQQKKITIPFVKASLGW